MTRISKKIMAWILGAVAFVAIAFGLAIARPQVKTAKAAETAVTFSAATLGDATHDTYGTSIRFDTTGATFAPTTYYNWVSAADYTSISDYTTVNGRTVTEINNAHPDKQPITLMMQNTGSFSFLRLYIPAEIMLISDVKSMGILDGWSFTDTKNDGTTYTSSAVTFLRTGDKMVEASNYTELTKVTPTISTAVSGYRTANSLGGDSWVVSIDLGTGVAYPYYDMMYSGYKFLRNAIYINGKSMEEWNTQAIAENPALGEPSTYVVFPQNSTDPTHLEPFVRPVGLWGNNTDDVVKLTIHKSLVADVEEIVVTVGAGACVSGQFMVAETVSNVVHTQTTEDITNKIACMTNTIDEANKYAIYYIFTGNSTAYWTASARNGGCLGEEVTGKGGQSLLKYVYFNGTSVYDINASDDGTYNSTQGNIQNGGVYAPIFADVSGEVGGAIKLIVPLHYAGLDENGAGINDTESGVVNNHREITLKRGLSIYDPTTGISSYLMNDVVFTNTTGGVAGNTRWTKEIKGMEIETEVTGIVTKANRTDGGNNENFVIFQLSNNDYSGCNTTAITDISSLYGYIDIGGTVIESYSGEKFFNVWGINNSVAFRFADAATLQNVPYITIKAGAKFPSYQTQNGGVLTYYVTRADITFVHDVPNDVWTVGEIPGEEEENVVDITNELTFAYQDEYTTGTKTYLIKTNNAYWTKAPQGGCLNEYDPNGAGGGQEQMKYIYFNGTSLYDINKDDNGSYNSQQSNIASGGIYAPILVTMGLNGTYSYIQIHVPTEYPTLGATQNENHRSFEIKSGFTVTENETTWKVTEDVKWVNLNGTWVNEKTTFGASAVTIGNPRIDGTAKELYKVDVTSDIWSITCNNYDFMYGNQYAEYRKSIFINGVSVYDINANTDDSSYVYSSSPMTGDAELFAHPVLIETHNQSGDPHTITLWIHENYINSLGDNTIITLGAGYNAYTNGLTLSENVDYDMIANVTIDNGTKITTERIVKGTTLESLGTPSKGMTDTTVYTFENWYITDTNTVYDATAPITGDISVEARFIEEAVNLIDTEVFGIIHYLKTSDDNWLAFELSENDYANAAENYSMDGYAELLRIGFLDKVTLRGTIVLNNSSTVSEATLMDVYNSYGPLQGPLLNFWNQGKFALRLPVGDGVEEIIIEGGCFFPSYETVSGGADIRYVVQRTTRYVYDEGMGVFAKKAALSVDIQMEAGAAVRVTSDMTTSGIRFQTNIAKADIDKLYNKLKDGDYQSITFGTLIVPTDYLMGGQFTHAWLSKNDMDYLDIESTAGFYENGILIQDSSQLIWHEKVEGYFSFFGSIVKLKEGNYNRAFSGLGYIKLVSLDDNGVEYCEYIYADYQKANSRSASFVANAAINDRNDNQGELYKHLTANNNYSPYTGDERTFLANYLTWTEESAVAAQSYELSKGASVTITPSTPKLAGAYVELVYSTTIDVWGVFTYTDGSKTASEDFYLQEGTSSHKQYLDIFRYNGVGYGMDTSNLTMVSIKLTNAELENKSGTVKLLGLYSQKKTIDTANQEIYVTVKQDNGSEMTVGAHLGIGGALTYLAKSGIYEGVIGGSSSWKNGTVAISTDSSVFDSTNRYKSGSSSSSYSTEDGYYGHATSSKPADGAVNLINNFDAGRQIQQSWYAQVGGSDKATDGSNGYNRAYCYTGSSAGQYWPYNPVQAGDVVSNPGQIVDYEVNEAKGYIYVKARAMDWAKGYDPDRPCENAVEGGVTTKSYVENYYRLGTDGTVIVNNAFIDWNGFTGMENCAWASTELPAVYPVHTLNYYVSNVDGDGSWTDAIEYKGDLSAWTGGTAYHQFANPANGDTKVEDWFAWANGGNGNAFGMGMYIPNVDRYTSGRSNTSTAYYTDNNFQNSNALPVPDYKSWFTSQVSEFAQRGNILADKGMMSNMQPIRYTYQSAYVSNTSYTAPGIDFRMEAYVPIEYSYVLCVDTVNNIRSTFKDIKDKGTITNAGNGYEKVGLDAWARADKTWTW